MHSARNQEYTQKFIPDYNNIIPTKPYTEDILGLPVINIRYVPLSNTFNAMIKRTMDVIGSSIAIIVSSPVMLILCILIKLTSPGPLIYKQERVAAFIIRLSGCINSVPWRSRRSPKKRKHGL